ncbi:MAG TPA: hypothetical protein VN682_24355 [Terriglobales bacterium]|nr:hypothetical protein [Terriglobales bacterium]
MVPRSAEVTQLQESKLLTDFRSRISKVNTEKSARYKVTRAVAFGDFLSDKVRFQSPEVGIELKSSSRNTVDVGSPQDQ